MIIGKNILQKPQNHKKYTIKYENLYFYFMLCILWNTFKNLRLIFREKKALHLPQNWKIGQMWRCSDGTIDKFKLYSMDV